jgi:transcriptional regulator GlxA family with amidase domain
MRRIGIFVFDDAEELDFVGPLEVFGAANRLRPDTFEVSTVGDSGREVRGTYGLRVKPNHSFQGCPKMNILIVPGGRGARREMKNLHALQFVKKRAENCEYVASVCTGALILAAAGLLNGKRATTHWAALDELRQFAKVRVEHRRYIRQGRIVTSGGISAGIDMALYLVGLFHGSRLRKEVAHRMEYVEKRPKTLRNK